MINKERNYTVPIVITALLFALTGVLMLYLGVLFTVLTLVNPFILMIVALLVARYIRWAYHSLRKRILKRQRLTIRQFLE
jgi:amino acid transporter